MIQILGELLGGIALLAIGIILSASNSRIVFIGLIVSGAASVIAAFVNLIRYLKKAGTASGENGTAAPKKMKKGVKTALCIAGALVLVFLGLFAYDKISRSIENENYARLNAYIADLDVENAELIARKIPGGSSLLILDETRRFAEAFDAGDWQGAADIWESSPGGSIYGRGRINAAYYKCRWKLIEPEINAAVEAGNWADAWNKASSFYWDIYPAGNASNSNRLDAFEEYFPEDAANWRKAFDASGAALFAAGDYKAVEGFLKLYANTHSGARKNRFGSFSWYEDAEARWTGGN